MQAREVLQEAERYFISKQLFYFSLCSVPDFAASDDYAVLDSLIDAVTSNDEDGIKQACSSGVFRAMDPEVTSFNYNSMIISSYYNSLQNLYMIFKQDKNLLLLLPLVPLRQSHLKAVILLPWK